MGFLLPGRRRIRRLYRVNGRKPFQFLTCLTLVKRLRKGSGGDFGKDLLKNKLLPIPLEFVAQDKLAAFPFGQMGHDAAAARIFAVTPDRSVTFRLLVPPCDSQARNLPGGFVQTDPRFKTSVKL